MLTEKDKIAKYKTALINIYTLSLFALSGDQNKFIRDIQKEVVRVLDEQIQES